MQSTALCLAGLLRDLPATARRLQSFLAQPLGADVFLSGPLEPQLLGALQELGSLRQLRLEQENITGALYSSRSPHLKAALSVKGNWLGCLERELPENRFKDMRRKGGGLCHIYGQKQCMLMIEEWEAKHDHRYERVVFSRQAMLWP